MSNVYFIGTYNGSKFNTVVDKKSLQTLLGCVLDGEDEFVDNAININTLEGQCINAMSWESEEFIKDMITALDINGRFAINHNNLIFGVATDEVNAMAAYNGKEF